MERSNSSQHTRRQRGAAIVETVIALPILLALILGAIQFGLIYQAKATLNHAALQAARAGSVEHAQPAALRRGLARGLAPLYSPDSSLEGVVGTVAKLNAELATEARVRILNPTTEAFDDFAEEVDGEREIPNERLHTQSTALGTRSGINLQDANLLRVQVTYGYELKVPLVNWFIARTLLRTSAGSDAFERQLLRRGRMPLLATATVRMQSAARPSDAVVSLADLPDIDRIPADSAPPADDDDSDAADAETQDGDSQPGSSDDGSNMADPFGGFGDGPPDAEDPAEGDEGGGSGSRGPEEGDTQDTDQPSDELCTPPDPQAQSDADDDTGVIGQVWKELKRLAKDAALFIEGFWEGIKSQLADLAHAITSPIETAKGLYQLAKSFIQDAPGTVRIIGEAIGKDLAALVHCGAFDRGRLLGENVSPAAFMKVVVKLAKYGGGGLGRAFRETKREIGCASFERGTLVLTPNGAVSIENIRVGQQVRSRSYHSFLDSNQRVIQTFERTAASHIVLASETQVFRLTEEHPLWVQGHGWTPARDVAVTQAIAGISGDVLIVAKSSVNAPLAVHNFSVDQTSSYFVGKDGLWVHNSWCSIWDLDPRKRGRIIEEFLASTDYKDWQRTDTLINPKTGQPFRSKNFPLVDFQKGDVVVSVKTVNTATRSWMRDMKEHIDDLATAKISVDGKPVTPILDIRVQPGGEGAAEALIAYGKLQGIKVTVAKLDL